MPATTQQIEKIARRFVDEVHVGENQTAKIDMDQLKLSAEAAFNWVESNRVSFNAAMLEPFKGVANARQKAQLLKFAIDSLVEIS